MTRLESAAKFAVNIWSAANRAENECLADCQSSTHQHRGCNQRCHHDHDSQDPAVVLSRIAQRADEMSSIVEGNQGNHRVTCRSAHRHHYKELAHRVFQYSCGGKQSACREREGHSRGHCQTPRPPLLEISERLLDPALAEFLL